MLNEVGRTGVQVNLTADGVFGVVTQDPESMLHTLGGLTNATGNTNFGSSFELSAFSSVATSATTTVNLCASDAPFKFRVLSANVRCLDDGKDAASGGQNGCSVSLNQGGSLGFGEVDCTGIKSGEVRPVKVSSFSGNDVVAANGSLRVVFKNRCGLHDKAFTFNLVCTLNCVRVL